MGSRDDQTKPHQPLLSSLLVRPADSVDGGSTDYEPGEVRPDLPPHSRSDRYSDDHHGYSTRAVSGSPTRHRYADRRYSTDFDQPRDFRQGRGFGAGRAAVRSPGRYRAYSPQARGRGIGRPLDDPGFGPGRFRGEGRNNPNVRPREGDWYCPDPVCGNLNFARREHCNSCNRDRYGPIRSPRRGYGGPPPPPVGPPRHFAGPPMDHFQDRFMDSYRSPPRGFPSRDVGFTGGPPPPTRLLADHHHHPLPREQTMFSRPPPPDWPSRGDRGGGRDILLYNDRRGYDRRPVSPPPLARWSDRGDVRERSRSPFRAPPPPKDFRHDLYMDRGRDERRGPDRDRIGSVY